MRIQGIHPLTIFTCKPRCVFGIKQSSCSTYSTRNLTTGNDNSCMFRMKSSAYRACMHSQSLPEDDDVSSVPKPSAYIAYNHSQTPPGDGDVPSTSNLPHTARLQLIHLPLAIFPCRRRHAFRLPRARCGIPPLTSHTAHYQLAIFHLKTTIRRPS